MSPIVSSPVSPLHPPPINVNEPLFLSFSRACSAQTYPILGFRIPPNSQLETLILGSASRRYEAAGWLRKMVGVVGAKDLPAEPSEEELRLGLRSGIILCNVLNKVQPGAVSKVVESPCDSALIPDGAALSAFQYFENVRNFLVAVQELGLPNFEASDLEQGGKSARVVNCVLAIKSYSDWKQTGGNGVWKFGGNVKPATSSKSFVRKNSEPFTNSLSRNLSVNDKSFSAPDIDYNKMSGSSSLGMLVRAVLLDKKPEEVPMLVESVLAKVLEEFEHHITSQNVYAWRYMCVYI